MKAIIRITVALCLVSATISSAAAQERSQPGGAQTNPWTIAGVVVDSITGQPLDGVSVLIAPVEHRDATQSTRTGSDGRFSFQRLARAKYSLAANRRGYPAQGFNQHDAYATAIVVGPGLDSEHIVFRLRPEATIRGKVTDEENEAVQNATVRLFATRIVDGRLATQMVRVNMSDDQGNYAFPHLPDGTYYLAVTGRPWYSTPSYRNGRARRVIVRDGVAASGQQPTPDADSDTSSAASKQDDGGASLDKTYPLTFFRDALTSADATAIELNPGESTTADITVRAVPRIYVHIPRSNLPAEPDPNAQQAGGVTNYSGSAGVTRIRRASQDTRVQLFYSVFDGELIPAEMEMMGSNESFDIGTAPGHYFAQIFNGNDGGSYQEVDLASDMELPPAAAPTGSVSGVAEFDTNTPPSYLSLTLSNRLTSQQYGVRLTAAGEFRIEEPIIPGKYEIAVGNSPGWYLQSVSATGAKLSGRMLHVSSAAPVRLTVKLGHGLGQVDGVAMRDGKPWAGAMVVLVPRNPGNNSVLFRRDESDSDGTFTLSDVVPGSYNLIAIEGGWKLAWSDPKVLQPYLKASETLQLLPDAKTQATVQVQDR